MTQQAVDIIGRLADERRVEQIVCNITHRSPDNPDLKDLVQLVYLILLEYDSDKIVELWENEQINFFIVRVIINQYSSKNSTYYYMFRKFLAQSNEIAAGFDTIDISTIEE